MEIAFFLPHGVQHGPYVGYLLQGRLVPHVAGEGACGESKVSFSPPTREGKREGTR